MEYRDETNVGAVINFVGTKFTLKEAGSSDGTEAPTWETTTDQYRNTINNVGFDCNDPDI